MEVPTEHNLKISIMNSNVKPSKENFNHLVGKKQKLSKTKGKVWKGTLRNKSF